MAGVVSLKRFQSGMFFRNFVCVKNQISTSLQDIRPKIRLKLDTDEDKLQCVCVRACVCVGAYACACVQREHRYDSLLVYVLIRFDF